tara:strand:+ start:448 stop:639 length:192 start_codon:yes stop_codon:yes gene_type:complete
MTKEKIRNKIASIYWSLKRDHQALWDQGDDKEIYYDVGLCVAYCYSIDKYSLADKIYDKFMDD